MSTLLQDLRFAVRMLRRAPAVSLLAVACIALGIGANTTIFSTATAFTFKPLPQLDHPERLVLVAEVPARQPELMGSVSAPTVADLNRETVFAGVSAVDGWDANVAGTDLAERVGGTHVSGNFFQVVGRQPVLGRAIDAQDDQPGHGNVVVLSHGLWQRRFGADPSIIGRVIRINGEGYTVVGVMGPNFAFPNGTQLWTPLALDAEAAAARANRNLFCMARLAPGVSLAQAGEAVQRVALRLAQDHPETNAEWTLRLNPAELAYESGPRPFMMVLLGAVVFVLLIACANVANLLLVGATARRHETAVRVALGANARRLVRQHLVESLVLGAIGGALGVLLSLWGVTLMAAAIPPELRVVITGFQSLAIDGRALAYSAVLTVLASVIFGVAPALAAARADVREALAGTGQGKHTGSGGRLRNVLVVSEIALSLMLLVGAALMVRSSRRMLLADPGFRTRGVLTMSVTLPPADYADGAAITRFYDRLVDDVRTLPGVDDAGATSILPLSWYEWRTHVLLEDRAQEKEETAPVLGYRLVSAGYMRAVGMALVAGRGFTDDDRADAPPVVIVSQSAARRLWPGTEAIGRRLKTSAHDSAWAEVVGVAADVRGNPLTSDDPRSIVYRPLAQSPGRTMWLVVRASGDPVSLAPAVQRAITSLDSRLGAGDVSPMTRVVAGAVSPQTATAQSMALFAVIALIMALVGIYGVMAFTVTQRTREIGIRAALGATPSGVVRMVLGRAGWLVGIGTAIGIVGTFAMGLALRAILFETSATDPATIAVTAAALLGVALLASWLPARRAARVDPMVALRSE